MGFSETLNALCVVLSSLCPFVAMGWYYLQLRRRETAASFTNLILSIINDALLSAAAIYNHQGIGPLLVSGSFAFAGTVCAYEVWRQGNEKLIFSRLDYSCAIGCVLGWVDLLSCNLELATHFIKSDTLALFGSLIGTTLNTIVCIPLMGVFLSEPGPTGKLPHRRFRSLRFLNPIWPFIVGTIGFLSALLIVPTTSFATMAQPVGLFLNNVVITVLAAVWAWRRM